MYLTLLHINAGNQPGRQWLGNLYRVHQRLWMAFPDQKQRIDDPYFLAPWDGPPLPESKPPRKEAGFLFRLERDGPARILVQSAQRPDWEYAFQNAPYLLACSAKVREFNPTPRRGERYRFRLLAHVVDRQTVAREQTRTTRSGKTIAKRRRKETWVLPAPVPATLPTDAKERQRLLSARWDSWRDWLNRLGGRAGFQVLDEPATPLLVQAVRSFVRDPENQKAMRYNGGLFDGMLRVEDPDAARDAITRGIGPAKAFGFGLLSIAPVRE